jgi:hypothetical protein
MKKLLLFLSVFFLALQTFAAPAGGSLRVDVISEEYISEVSSCKDISIGRRKRFAKKRGGERSEIYDIFYTGGKLTGEWKKIELNFTPKKSENISFWLRSNPGGTEGKYPFINIDDLTVKGASLKNGSFETLGKNKNFSGWRNCSTENVCTKSPRNGTYCIRVNYAKSVYQQLKVTENVPVTITFYARQENPLKTDRGSDGMTNIYTDTGSGSQVHISTGRLLLVPTFENCSYYINRKKNEWEKKCSLKVFYREKGTKEWIPVMDPVNMEREKAWRGSIMLLKEDTPYEFRAVVSGEAKDEIRSKFRTRSSKFKVAETIVLDSSNFNGYLKDIKSGKPDGYVLYKSAPGFVLKGKPGISGGVIECVKAKYVIFEGLVIDANRSRHGIKLVDCENVIVRKCEIYNFGRCDRIRDMRLGGRWVHKGRITGWDGGINLHGGKRYLIERCYIHTPWSSANSWFYSHPSGPVGIFIDKIKGESVIRYNDLIGSDARRWNDAIESAGNGDIDGGFFRDCDIYGNLLAYSNDDSIEMEGGEMNVRFYYNRVQGSYNGVSTGCCRLGPSYQYRNVHYRLADENNRDEGYFKNGMGDQGDGAIFILNNTTWSPTITSAFGGFHAKPPVYNPPLKGFSRNNIIVSKGGYVSNEWRTWNCNLDNDLFFGAKSDIVESFKNKMASWKQEKKAIYADPRYSNVKSGDLRLAADSPARNRAEKLPGFNVKHLGAFQDDNLEIPYRPVALSLDKYTIEYNLADSGKVYKFTLKSGNYAGSFKVRCNDTFFTVTPAEGKIARNSSVTFSVKLNKDQIKMARIHNGMALIRFEDGFSKAVSVYADFREDAKLIADAKRDKALMVKDIKLSKGVYTGKVTVPEKGCYFLLCEGKVQGWAKVDVTIGNVKINSRRARLISRRPGFAVVRNGHLSAYYIYLDKGSFDLSLKTNMRGARINKMFLTKDPEFFLK